MNYAKHVVSTQREPLTGQVQNSAGGYAFPVDDWTRLDRFLVLGSDGGSYYAGERKLTRENAACVERCIKADGPRTVARITDISRAGRAPKNEPALFALAMCAKLGDDQTRRLAQLSLPAVARTGTHLFHFAEYVKAFGGWGRGTMRAFAHWYTERDADYLALQAIKYQQRDGWSHRDILRKCHARSPSEQHKAILHWMVKGWDAVGPEPHSDEVLRKIWAFERAKTARGAELVNLIWQYGLPHECVPNEAKGDPKVWEAMLPSMGLTALIRNLGKMTSVGLITPMSAAAKMVAQRLEDAERLREARIHPLQVLVALNIYGQGHGDKGKLSWSPVSRVTNALDAAFYASFKAVEPTGKRTMLALDISGSMGSPEIAGMSGVTPRVGSAAMALVTANVEQEHLFVGFTAGASPSQWSRSHGLGTGLTPLDISPRQRLDDVVRYTSNLPMGGTDCSLPMVWAAQSKTPIDTFCVYTDSETWAGNVHPARALKDYRQKMGIGAKLVVVGMVANEFTIADPNDAGMLDVVGFDTATPGLIADFARDA